MPENQNEVEVAPVAPVEKPAPIIVPEILELETVVNVDSLTNNSVVVLRFKEASPRVAFTIQTLVQRYGQQIREKNISVLVMSPDDSVETLDEEKMNAVGWFKKAPASSLIIPV